MKQEEKIKALREAILEANTRETYGLYNINNVIVEAKDLDNLGIALDTLEAGFNLTTFVLTTGQKRIFKAYGIDTEKGKTLNGDNIKELAKKIERNKSYEEER